tara:strand:+ start:300 stop:530 length:231 start_codon:yes stop_codon:yes gene_type:complete
MSPVASFEPGIFHSTREPVVKLCIFQILIMKSEVDRIDSIHTAIRYDAAYLFLINIRRIDIEHNAYHFISFTCPRY